MKNNKLRLASFALAMALSLQALTVLAFAETTTPAAAPITLTQGSTSSGTAAADRFYFDLSGAFSQAVTAAAITGFDRTNDWLVLKLPAGAAVSVAASANSPSDTSTVSVTPSGGSSQPVVNINGAYAANLDSRIIFTDTPIVTEISADKTTVDKLTASTVTLTPAVTLYDNTAPTTATTYKWTVPTGTSTSATSSLTGKNLTINAGQMAAGNHTFTLTATAGGKSTSASIQITVVAVCNAALDSINVTSGAGNHINVDSATVTRQLTATPVFTDECSLSHADAATHDKTINYSWSIDPAVSGASVDSSGLLTIQRNTFPVEESTPVKVVVTGGVQAPQTPKNGSTPQGALSLTVTSITTCEYSTTGVAISNPVTTINADTTTTQAYTATVSGTSVSCNDPVHSSAGTHRTATWSITTIPLPAGVSIDPATGVLTITKNSLAGAATSITIKAEVDTFSATENITINKSIVCNKALSALGAITPGAVGNSSTTQLIRENSRTVLAITGAGTGTLQFSMGSGKPTYTGTCGYETSGKPSDCPNLAGHTVAWAIENPPAGISISSAGLLSVNIAQVTSKETSVKVTATVGSSSTHGYIVVHKGAYSTSGGDDDNESSTQQQNYQQWNTIDRKLDNAYSNDTIRANLSDNTDMPSRIMETIRGRNVTAEFTVDGGYIWTINGKNLKKIPSYQIYIPLGVNRITDSKIARLAKYNDLATFELDHEGSFYGTYNLSLRLDTDYAKKTVYLYKYLPDSSKLSYKGSARVDSDGFVSFPFTSASTYVIVDRSLYGESSGGASVGGNGSSVSAAPSSSVAPPSSSGVSSSSSSSVSSEPSSVSEIPSSSSEISKPADVEPEQPEEPAKKKSIPIIVPILLVVVTLTIIAVVMLAKGGMHMG